MRPNRLSPAPLALCLIALAACGDGAGPPTAGTPEAPVPGVATGPAEPAAEPPGSPLQASLSVVSAEPTMRYPKALWTVELELANHGSEPVWFLVPEPPEFSPDLERQAWAIEAIRLGGSAAVTLVRISATHGLLAFRLAPRAALTVRGLSLESWHPEPVGTMEIWAVSEIRIDDRRLMGGWLGALDPTVSGTVEADAAAADESIYEWADPELRSHALAYAPRARWPLETGLDETNWPWRPSE